MRGARRHLPSKPGVHLLRSTLAAGVDWHRPVPRHRDRRRVTALALARQMRWWCSTSWARSACPRPCAARPMWYCNRVRRAQLAQRTARHLRALMVGHCATKGPTHLLACGTTSCDANGHSAGPHRRRAGACARRRSPGTGPPGSPFSAGSEGSRTTRSGATSRRPCARTCQPHGGRRPRGDRGHSKRHAGAGLAHRRQPGLAGQRLRRCLRAGRRRGAGHPAGTGQRRSDMLPRLAGQLAPRAHCSRRRRNGQPFTNSSVR